MARRCRDSKDVPACHCGCILLFSRGSTSDCSRPNHCLNRVFVLATLEERVETDSSGDLVIWSGVIDQIGKGSLGDWRTGVSRDRGSVTFRACRNTSARVVMDRPMRARFVKQDVMQSLDLRRLFPPWAGNDGSGQLDKYRRSAMRLESRPDLELGYQVRDVVRPCVSLRKR